MLFFFFLETFQQASLDFLYNDLSLFEAVFLSLFFFVFFLTGVIFLILSVSSRLAHEQTILNKGPLHVSQKLPLNLGHLPPELRSMCKNISHCLFCFLVNTFF